jgi:hypothetical protein
MAAAVAFGLPEVVRTGELGDKIDSLGLHGYPNDWLIQAAAEGRHDLVFLIIESRWTDDPPISIPALEAAVASSRKRISIKYLKGVLRTASFAKLLSEASHRLADLPPPVADFLRWDHSQGRDRFQTLLARSATALQVVGGGAPQWALIDEIRRRVRTRSCKRSRTCPDRTAAQPDSTAADDCHNLELNHKRTRIGDDLLEPMGNMAIREPE